MPKADLLNSKRTHKYSLDRCGWDEILHDEIDLRHKPCNSVELMPRLVEHLE